MRLSLLAATAAFGVAAFTLAACDDGADTDIVVEEEDGLGMDAEEEMDVAEDLAVEDDIAEMADENDLAGEDDMAMADSEPAPAGPPGGMPQGPSEIAYDSIGGGESIEVMLPDILDDADGEIAERYSAYGDGVSPEITWTSVDGAESYAMIMQDPIEAMNFIVLHWVVYNIPGDVTALPEGIEPGAEIPAVPGAMQANNIAQTMGYAGPRPPAGQPAHNYTFQVFALDTTLDVDQGVTYDGLLEAMDGHVIGSGMTVAPYSPPADAQ